MTITSTCDNPMCSCDPCGCDDCRCGAANLGELERRVMEILWRSEGHEVSGREVADQLPAYAYTTVATILDRLGRKGMLTRRLVGRKIQFAAVGNKGSHTAVLMHATLHQDEDPESALLRFAESLSGSEASILRRALNRLDRAAHP
jgi:predicted transcriptional regulator